MHNRKCSFLGHPLFLKLSLIILIAGFVTSLLSLGRMSQTRDEHGSLSGTDPSYLQLSLGLVILMVGAFSVLFHFINKSGRFLAHLGYDTTMLDNIRADIEMQNVRIGAARDAAESVETRTTAGSWSSLRSTIPRESFASESPLLPVEPARVHLPPPTVDELELLVE